jgi:hypothetical protein
MTIRGSITTGNFELELDGAVTTAFLKSIDGGWAKHALVDESIGGENNRIKHASVAEIDPISFEFGMSGANSVLKWIQASWRKQWVRKNGQITHGDFNHRSTFIHQFKEALITETTFPTMDGASKDAAYVKVKVQPEAVVTQKGDGNSLRPMGGGKQKMWLCSGFRLNIDGIDDAKYVNKIESFTVKQGIKKFYVGSERFPQIEPTKLEFPNLTGTISTQYGDGFHAWYQDYVVKGQRAKSGEKKSGSLEFLSPDRGKTLFRIKLNEIGLLSLSIPQMTANSDQIKRFKFELSIGNMDMDSDATLGLD